MYEISKTLTIQMGHRLSNHGGACRNLHGHEYFIELFVSTSNLQSSGSTEGMVLDYAMLKKAMAPIDAIFDHAMTLSIDDPILPFLMEGSAAEKQDYIKRMKECNDVFSTFSGVQSTRLVVVKQPPTAEVLGSVWLFIIKRLLVEIAGTNGFKVSKLVVRETSTSCAIVNGDISFEEIALSYKDWRRPS